MAWARVSSPDAELHTILQNMNRVAAEFDASAGRRPPAVPPQTAYMRAPATPTAAPPVTPQQQPTPIAAAAIADAAVINRYKRALQDMKREHETQRAAADTEIAALKAELGRVKSVKSAKAADATQQLRTVQLEHRQLADQNAALQAQLQLHLQDNKTLRDRALMQDTVVTKLRERLEETQSKAADMQRVIDTLSQREQHIPYLEEKAALVKTLQQSLEDTQTIVQKQTQQIEQLTQQRDSLLDFVEEANKTMQAQDKQLAANQVTIEILSNNVQTARRNELAVSDGAANAFVTASQTKIALEHAEARIAAAEAELQRLRTTCNDLNAQNRELEAVQEELLQVIQTQAADLAKRSNSLAVGPTFTSPSKPQHPPLPPPPSPPRVIKLDVTTQTDADVTLLEKQEQLRVATAVSEELRNRLSDAHKQMSELRAQSERLIAVETFVGQVLSTQSRVPDVDAATIAISWHESWCYHAPLQGLCPNIAAAASRLIADSRIMFNRENDTRTQAKQRQANWARERKVLESSLSRCQTQLKVLRAQLAVARGAPIEDVGGSTDSDSDSSHILPVLDRSMVSDSATSTLST